MRIIIYPKTAEFIILLEEYIDFVVHHRLRNFLILKFFKCCNRWRTDSTIITAHLQSTQNLKLPNSLNSRNAENIHHNNRKPIAKEMTEATKTCEKFPRNKTRQKPRLMHLPKIFSRFQWHYLPFWSGLETLINFTPS